MLDIKITLTTNPKAKPADESKLGFGKIFTDHMFLMDYNPEQGWHDARIVPYAPFQLDPACVVFHYAQELFEGMKAYRTAENNIQLFRPENVDGDALNSCALVGADGNGVSYFSGGCGIGCTAASAGAVVIVMSQGLSLLICAQFAHLRFDTGRIKVCVSGAFGGLGIFVIAVLALIVHATGGGAGRVDLSDQHIVMGAICGQILGQFIATVNANTLLVDMSQSPAGNVAAEGTHGGFGAGGCCEAVFQSGDFLHKFLATKRAAGDHTAVFGTGG